MPTPRILLTFATIALAAGLALAQAAKPRDPVVIKIDVEDLEQSLFATYNIAALLDPARRTEIQEKAAPYFKKRLALTKEMFAADPKADENPFWVSKYIASLAWLTLYGDDDARKTLEAHANSANRTMALYGKLGKFMATWYTHIKDQDELEKLLEQAKTFADRAPKDEVVGTFFVGFCNDGIKYPEPFREKLEAFVSGEFPSYAVRAWKAIPRMGRPYSFAGTLVNGKPFDTASLKGKVIVLHFWLTTDARYRNHFAKLAEIYKAYPRADVEFVGVSLDESPRFAEGYLQGHPELTWPQFYDAKLKGVHPLVRSLGFRPIALPTTPPLLELTIIDKEGRYRGSNFTLDTVRAGIKTALTPRPAASQPTTTTTKPALKPTTAPAQKS